MQALGLDIEPHRRRMNESQPGWMRSFKDTDDPLRLVFVCAMWLTGFRRTELLDGVSRQAHAQPHADADHRPRQPGVSRQAQRRHRRLRQRLCLAGKGTGHLRCRQGRARVRYKDKQQLLVEELRKAVVDATAFCAVHGVMLLAEIEALNAGR
jgi:type I restriction enzyme R subunit